MQDHYERVGVLRPCFSEPLSPMLVKMRPRWIGRGILMRKRMIASGVVAICAALLALLVRRPFAKGRHARRLVREAGDHVARWLQRREGAWWGVSYQLKARRPDPDVSDLVLADRIRSTLGPLEKRLDLPRIHVMVDQHTAVLHGEVGTEHERTSIEKAVARVSGVVGVQSFLHLGLAQGDTRPSESKKEALVASHARSTLLSAAREAGVAENHLTTAVRAILGSLAEKIPPHELAQVQAHLPADARELLHPPRRSGAAFRRTDTVSEFVAAVLSADGISPESAHDAVRAVFSALKDLIPEEVADVSAVLPHELRELWKAS